MNERKVSLFMVRAAKWKDLGEIRRRMNGVQILDVIATEIDGEPMILLFVAVTEAEYNLKHGELILEFDTKGIYNI